MSVFEAASIQAFESQGQGIVGKKFYFSKDASIDQKSIDFGANLLITTISAAYSEDYPDPFVAQGPLKFKVFNKKLSYSALMLPIIATDEGRQSQFVCVILISKKDKYLRKVAEFIGKYFADIKQKRKKNFYDYINNEFSHIIASLEEKIQSSNTQGIKEPSLHKEDTEFFMNFNKIDTALIDITKRFPNINSIIFDKNQLVVSNNTKAFSEDDLLYVGAMTGSALVQLSKVMTKYSTTHFYSNNNIPVEDDITNTKVLSEQVISGKTIRLRIAAKNNYIVVVFGTEISLGMLALASDYLLKRIENLEV